MSIDLFEAAKTLKLTTFRYVSSQKVATDAKEATHDKEAEPASFYLILQLEEAIPKITGSNGMYDAVNRVMVPYTALDVTEVRVHANMLEKYRKEFTDTEMNGTSFSGTYSGDLILDVSSSMDVWLQDVKMSAMSQNMKKLNRLSRLNNLKSIR